MFRHGDPTKDEALGGSNNRAEGSRGIGAERAGVGQVVAVGVGVLILGEGAAISGGLMAPEQARAGKVAEEDEGRGRAARAGSAGRLVDVLVVPDALRAESGVRGEIVLPASTNDGAAIVTAILRDIWSHVHLGACDAVDVYVVG